MSTSEFLHSKNSISKYFVLPSTTGSSQMNVAIQVFSTLEQRITLFLDGAEICDCTGSGDEELGRWTLEPGPPRDCQIVFSHRMPGDSWVNNEFAGPVLKGVADVRSLEIMSYDRSDPDKDRASIIVIFSWWGNPADNL